MYMLPDFCPTLSPFWYVASNNESSALSSLYVRGLELAGVEDAETSEVRSKTLLVVRAFSMVLGTPAFQGGVR